MGLTRVDATNAAKAFTKEHQCRMVVVRFREGAYSGTAYEFVALEEEVYQAAQKLGLVAPTDIKTVVNNGRIILDLK